MSVSNTKTKDSLIVASVLSAVQNRKPSPRQIAFLTAAGTSPTELEHLTVQSASAKIRLIIADRKSPDEVPFEERLPTEPSEAQCELATKIGLSAQAIMDASSAELSEMLSERLAELGRRKDEARALPASERQIAALARFGYADGATLTRGQASDALSAIVKSFRKAPR